MSLPLLVALLAIAMEPGLSVSDLAERIGAPQQTASRYSAFLQGRYEIPGDNTSLFVHTPFVTLEISPVDPRRRALTLTRHGQAWLDRFFQHLGSGIQGGGA